MGRSKIPRQQKHATMKRLEAEGRWEVACQRRKELRDSGMTADEAWLKMEEKYPPLESKEEGFPAGQLGESDLEDVDFDALLEKFGQNSPDFARDVFWVYENLSNHGAAPEDAPGLGAWNMLNWARGARTRFFEQVMPKISAAKSKQEEEKQTFDPSLEICEKLLKEAEKEWEQQMVENTSATIKETVQSCLSDWKRRFDVTLPSDAAEILELQVIELADHCVTVALKEPETFQTGV